MALKLISEKKRSGASQVLRMARLSQQGSEVDLQKKGLCASSLQVLIRMTVDVDQYFSTLFSIQTHFHGPPVGNHCVSNFTIIS